MVAQTSRTVPFLLLRLLPLEMRLSGDLKRTYSLFGPLESFLNGCPGRARAEPGIFRFSFIFSPNRAALGKCTPSPLWIFKVYLKTGTLA